MMPTLNDYLILSAILFAIGTAGVFVRRNVITILLSIEIMLNAVNLSFVAFGRALGTVDGQIIVFFVITVAAIGRSLFTDYAFAFEVTSVLILVAMVGAVVLAHREKA